MNITVNIPEEQVNIVLAARKKELKSGHEHAIRIFKNELEEARRKNRLLEQKIRKLQKELNVHQDRYEEYLEIIQQKERITETRKDIEKMLRGHHRAMLEASDHIEQIEEML